MTIPNRLWGAVIVGVALAIVGISLRSTNDTTAFGQSVQASPSQGPTGAAGANGSNGTNGTNGTNATVEQAKVLTTASDGTLTWTYPTAYGAGVVPVVECLAQSASTTTVVNCQLTATPTNTSAALRVTLTNVTVVTLIGLSILSVPTSPGVTTVHVTARAPSP